MKQAFQNVDVYLGVVAEVGGWLASARAWVLVPKIVETDFRKGGGWDIETKWLGKLPEWDWSTKDVDPLVQGVSLENSGEEPVMLMALETARLQTAAVRQISRFLPIRAKRRISCWRLTTMSPIRTSKTI